MSWFEILLAIFLVTGFIYWLDAMRARTIARAAGKQACDNDHLVFLDDTVSLNRIRFTRGEAGLLGLYREYGFEFTSDGSQRYRGSITMMGKQVTSITMEPYRVH